MMILLLDFYFREQEVIFQYLLQNQHLVKDAFHQEGKVHSDHHRQLQFEDLDLDELLQKRYERIFRLESASWPAGRSQLRWKLLRCAYALQYWNGRIMRDWRTGGKMGICNTNCILQPPFFMGYRRYIVRPFVRLRIGAKNPALLNNGTSCNTCELSDNCPSCFMCHNP